MSLNYIPVHVVVNLFFFSFLGRVHDTKIVEICSSVVPRYHQVYSVIIGFVNDNPALKHNQQTINQSVGHLKGCAE